MGLLPNILQGESKDLIGLDISASRVKLLELAKSGSGYRVESSGSEPLPQGAIEDKQIANPEIVGQAIARLVGRSGAKSRQAAVAVSGSSVISKLIEMPAHLREHEMEEQIGFEADQYIPYPVEEVALDFQVLKPSERDPELVEVLLAACRRDTIDRKVEALSYAGLTPKVVDVEAYAIQNACQLLSKQMPDGGKDKTIAVVDVGSSNTSVNVLHDLETVYTREQGFGGHQLTLEIMRNLGISEQEAEQARAQNRLPETYENEMMPAFIENLAQQIDRTLQFFFSSSPDYDSVDQIILAGGCATIPGIDSAIQNRVNIPTVIAEPLSNMKSSWRAKRNMPDEAEPAMLIACGLALRAFD